MKAIKTSLVAAVLCLPIAGQGWAERTPDARQVDVVRRKFSAFNQHDALAIQRLYATDARLHSPDYPDLAGNQSIAETYRRIFTAIPDARDDVKVLEAGSERMYVQFVLSGHMAGAADRPISVRIISVCRVKEGRILEDDITTTARCNGANAALLSEIYFDIAKRAHARRDAIGP
jgi:ketosteroid isomerase-like protein